MKENLHAILQNQWGDLLQKGKQLTYHKGQTLFYEGHNPMGLFVILSGQVEFTHVAHQDEHPCQGGHLSPAPQGKIIEFDQFFADKPFCCTCVAASDCKLVFISRSELMGVLEGVRH